MSKEICHEAYHQNLLRLNQNLTENLVLAAGDPQLEQEAQEKFKKGKQIADKTLNICLNEFK